MTAFLEGLLAAFRRAILPGNVRRSIVFHIFAAAICFTPGYQLAGRCFTGVTAAAQTCPVRSHPGALSAFAHNPQFAKGLAKQVVCRCLLRPFSPQAAAAEGTSAFEGALQHISFRAAVTAAEMFLFALCRSDNLVQ